MSAMGSMMPVHRMQERRLRGERAALAGVMLALPVIAGVAWWLAAMPALAQQPEAHSGAVAGTGEGTLPASAKPAERKQLLIVGATNMNVITEAVIKHMAEAYVLPEPTIRHEGTREGIAAFCAGVGPEYPDIAAASNRMSRGEFETCLDNNVLDVIEVKIGDIAVVVVTKKGDPVFNLTPRMVYYALAENIPIKGEFKANENKTWKDTEKEALDLPINVIVPTTGFRVLQYFDDNFMQGAGLFNAPHLKRLVSPKCHIWCGNDLW